MKYFLMFINSIRAWTVDVWGRYAGLGVSYYAPVLGLLRNYFRKYTFS